MRLFSWCCLVSPLSGEFSGCKVGLACTLLLCLHSLGVHRGLVGGVLAGMISDNILSMAECFGYVLTVDNNDRGPGSSRQSKMQMAEMDGCEAIRQIREVEKSYNVRISIIALTCHTPGEETTRMSDATMDDNLSKPLLMDRLLETMAVLIEGATSSFGVLGSSVPPKAQAVVVFWETSAIKPFALVEEA
ncbi:hypothetical protein ACLB2K_012463 [Fragaria x ananassa]